MRLTNENKYCTVRLRLFQASIILQAFYRFLHIFGGSVLRFYGGTLVMTYKGKYGFNPALAASALARFTRSSTAATDMPNLRVKGKIASVLNS